MTSKAKLLVSFVFFSTALLPSSLLAQGTCNPPSPPPCPSPNPFTGGTSFEISPYAGFIWPGTPSGLDTFMNNQLLGVRGGFYVASGFELGGNYSWNNHFQPKSSGISSGFAGGLGFPQGKSRAHIWEAEFTYNFGNHHFGGANLKPYVVGGAGGLTTQIS